MEKEMQRGPGVCWIIVGRAMRSSHFVLSSELLRTTLKRFHICFTEEEMKVQR
jgi:hypothetical protein